MNKLLIFNSNTVADKYTSHNMRYYKLILKLQLGILIVASFVNAMQEIRNKEAD